MLGGLKLRARVRLFLLMDPPQKGEELGCFWSALHTIFKISLSYYTLLRLNSVIHCSFIVVKHSDNATGRGNSGVEHLSKEFDHSGRWIQNKQRLLMVLLNEDKK